MIAKFKWEKRKVRRQNKKKGEKYSTNKWQGVKKSYKKKGK